MSTEGGTKAVVAALAANLGIAATKLLAYLLTQSSSMLAESVHSLADSGNQVLLLIGGKRARRAADPEHPFGYGRVRYVYAFIVAIVLFSVGGLFALYEAYEKWHEVSLGHPNGLLESRWWWVPVVVLLAAIVMESLSFRTAIRESNQVQRRGAVERLHPPGQVARAAGHPAGGLRRVAWSGVRARRRRADPAHPQWPVGCGRHGHDRAASRRGGRHPGRRDVLAAHRRGSHP